MIKLNWVISSTISVLLTTLYKRIYENSEELLSITFDTKLNSFLSLNVVLCTMLLATKIIERTIFGEFRSQEFAKTSERLVNYLLLKVVFFVGAFTVTSINFLIVWSIWYSIMGSLYLATLLCKDRFEYLLHVNSKLSDHLRIYLFLIAISLTNFSLFYFLYKELTGVSISLLLLLSYENIAVFINSVQLFAKYGIYFSKISDDQKGGGYFYTEITTDTLVHLFTVIHYLQILFKNGIYLTILDIVIFLNIYTICTALRANFVSFVNFRKLETLLNLYPNVSQSELQVHNDNCAICREPVLSSAKKLPCSHIYHESCLRLWLQHCLYTPTCPTCRFPLIRKNQQEINSSAPIAIQREQPIKKHLHVFERIQKTALKKSSSWASPASPSLYTPCKLEERSNDSLLDRRRKILSAVERRRSQTQEL